MVVVQKVKRVESSLLQRLCGQIFFTCFILVVFWLIVAFPDYNNNDEPVGDRPVEGHSASVAQKYCPYNTLNDLNQTELHPTADDSRYMVTPPTDTALTLVCCQTTKGPWNILVHHAWAPLGAARFVEMVQHDYFNTHTVPLMRCVHGFLCQFGLAGLASQESHKTLPDDPPWLPPGPDFRHTAAGVKRFAAGFLAYAGAGPHSRSNQFIVALRDNGPLAGGSPWETPWGELVGSHSFDTLAKIHTGYGEHGPTQGSLMKSGHVEHVTKNFPKLDWIETCHVVEERSM